MATVNVRHHLVRNKTAGIDPLVDKVLSGPCEEFTAYQRALKIYLSKVQKGYFEACLLAERDLGKIAELLESPPSVVAAYRDFFFDINGMNRIELLEVIYENTEEGEGDRAMMMWGLSQGLDFVAWRLGKQVAVNPVDGLKDLYTLCTFKCKEAFFTGNTAEASKEATKWAKLSMDLARLLKAWVMDGNAAKQEIEMALRTISPNFESYDAAENFSEGREGSEDPFSDMELSTGDFKIEGFEGLEDGQ